MTKTFYIYRGDEIIQTVEARDADTALDLFAQIVSGYDCFADMMRSRFFSSKFAGVFAA